MKKIALAMILLGMFTGCTSVPTANPKIMMTLETGEIMLFELYPKNAPKTVANFLNLVKEGTLNGTKFHRIIKTFMVQAGNVNADVTPIKGEFKNNGINNPTSHKYGTISMARTQIPDSATTQFFICTADQPYLDGEYAAFGQLIEGSETLDMIANTPVEKSGTGELSLPLKDIVIKEFKIVT